MAHLKNVNIFVLKPFKISSSQSKCFTYGIPTYLPTYLMVIFAVFLFAVFATKVVVFRTEIT